MVSLLCIKNLQGAAIAATCVNSVAAAVVVRVVDNVKTAANTKSKQTKSVFAVKEVICV